MTANSATIPAGGLFERLAVQQLAPERMPHGLRPQLPYPFEDASVRFHEEAETFAFSTSLPDYPHETEQTQRSDAGDIETPVMAVSPPAPAIIESRKGEGETVASPLRRPSSPASVAFPERAVAAPSLETHSEPKPSKPAVSSGKPDGGHVNHLHTFERLVQVQLESKLLPPEASHESAASAAPKPVTPAIEPARLRPRSPVPAMPLQADLVNPASEPTIEIHIGRVEVRAQVAPSTPAPAQRQAPSDQRLAAYLRNRGNGARS